MKKWIADSKRILTAMLAALLVVTSLPGAGLTAYADEISDADEILEDAAEIVENDATSEVVESVGAGNASVIDDEKEIESKDIEEENAEVEDGSDAENAYEDFTIAKIVGNTTANSKNVTIATETNGVVSAADSDDATSVKVNSENDEAYTFYIVPKSGYTVVSEPLDLKGSYIAASDGTDKVELSASDFTISAISDTEKTMDVSGASFANAAKSVAQTSSNYNWDDAVKVVLKGGEDSFLANYLVAEGAKVDVEIGLASTVVEKKTFEIPVYVYDAGAAEGSKYTQVLVNSSTGKSKLSATYDTLADENIDFSDAFSATEWANYTANFKVLTAGTDEAFDTDSSNLSVSAETDWSNKKGDSDDKYVIDESNHTLGLKAKLTRDIYLNAAEHSDETALVLLTKNTKYSITATDTDYVDFGYDNSATYDGKTTRGATGETKVKDALTSGYFSAVKKTDGSKGGRTLTKIYYTLNGGELTEATAGTNEWTIPEGAGNVVITGETTETVEFKETGWSSSNKIAVTLVDGNETAITPAYSTDQGSHTTTVLSGTGDLSFKVAPAVAGYNVGEVTVTRYKIDGSAALDGQSGIVLSPVNGVYTIEDVAGYVEVNIAVEAVTGTKRAVSIASGSDTGADIKDLKTGKPLTTSGVEYAVDTADYQFTVEPKAGYALAATDPVTVTANGETVPATKSGTTYTIAKANLTGPIIITVNTTAMLDVQKADNSYVGIALDGTTLGTDPVQVSTSGKISLILTPATGVTVSDVYYAETAPDSTKAAPATKFTKKTGSDNVYELDASAVYKFRVTDNHPTMYIYVKYSRDAVEGTDFVARTTNGKQTDGTNYDVIGASGITLYAGGLNVTGSNQPNNLIDEITTHFYAVSDTKYETALDGTNTTYALALEGETGEVATETETSGVDTITTAAKYVSTGMTDTLTATFTKTYTSDVKWNQTIVYKKEIPVTIKSLSDYYKATYGTLAAYVDSNTGTTNDGSVLDELRNDTSDAATLKLAYTDKTENDVVVTSSLATVTKNTWSVSPETATAALNAEYKVNNATVNPVDNNDVTVGNAKFATIPANGLTVTGAVTFIDDSTTIASKTLKVVENDYGYFAVPTVTINGESNIALSATNTISLEYGSDAKNAAKTATVSYAVYHAKTSTGKSFAYTTQTGLDDAVTAGDIELVAASNIDWANATLVGTDADYAKKYTVTNNNDGTFTITAKAAINADALTLTAKEKASGFTLQTKGSTTTQVTVVYAKTRYAVTFTTNDAAAAYPELTAAYLATVKESYTVETVKSDANVTGYVLTDVPTGTVLPLPAVSAFSGVAESKGIASWTIVASGTTYAKADGTGEATITQATTITPVWASLYSSTKSTYTQGIEAVNSVAEAAFDNTSNVIIVGSTPTVSVSAQYYALDPAPATPSGTAAYATTATPITTGTLAITAASEDATAFGATLNATTGKYDFAGTTLNPTEGTNAFDATVTWTPVGATTGLTGTIKNLQAKANGTEWVLDHDTVEVEVGQEITDTSLTLTKDGGATNLGDSAIVSKTLEISTANQTYATAEITTDSSNTLTFTGKTVTPAAGIPATLTIVDKENQTKTLDITIVVKAASYAIEAAITHDYGSGSITEASKTTIGANDTAELIIGSNTLDLSLTNADIKPISVAWTIKSTAPTGADAPANMFGSEVNESSSDTAVSKTISPTKLGASTLTITATVTDATTNTVIGKYTREIPLTSAAVVKVYGPDATNTNFGGNGKTEYASYSVSKGGTAFADAKYDVILVPYVKDATEYTVSDITNYTVTWLDSATTAQDFLGWKKGGDSNKGAISKATADLTVASSTGDALANTAAVISTSVAEATPSYYAYFKAAGITGVSVENKTITLSDATLDADYTKATNKDVIEIRVTPAQTTEKISVSSADTGFIDIADGNGNASASPLVTGGGKAYNIAALGDDVTDANGTSIGSGTHSNLWDGNTKLPITVKAPASTATYRTDKLLVGKVDGEVGTTTLTVWDEAGTTALETITVYVNGEYTDTADGKIKYMKDGEPLKNDSALVWNGTSGAQETHYYDKDGAKVTDGPFYVESAEKFILLKDGAQVKTIGKTEIATGDYAGTYYVGDATNGYLLTGFFNGVGTNDTDKKYYADPETGKLTISDKAEVSTGVYSYFNAYGQMEVASSSANLYEKVAGADYYVNADGELAIGNIFTVDGIDRLFDEDGTMITKAGEYTVGNQVYNVDEDGVASIADTRINAKVEWTGKWADTVSKAAPISQTWNYTITYDLLKAGTKGLTETGSVTADISWNADKTVLTYTAAVPENVLAGYYSDAKGSTVLSDEGLTKIYRFKTDKDESSKTQDIDSTGEFYVEELEEEYLYTGAAITPVIKVYDGDKLLAKGVDYTVSFKNNKKLTSVSGVKATVIIKGKGNYTGQAKTLSFSIVAPAEVENAFDLKGAKIKSIEPASFVYNGEAQYPTKITLQLKGGSAITYEGDPESGYSVVDGDGDLKAAVTISNNVNKGTATLLLTGAKNAKSGASTTVKKTFKITAASLQTEDGDEKLTPTIGKATYASKVAVPESFELEWATTGENLVAGQDYTVKYKYTNSKDKNAGPTAGTVTITGKGNFAKSITRTYAIDALELSDDNIAAIAAYAKVKAGSVKVSVLDGNGAVIPAKQLDVKITKDGSEVAKATKLDEKTTYTVEVKGVNETNISGSASKDVTIGANLNKAKIVGLSGKDAYKVTYTGSPIILEDLDVNPFEGENPAIKVNIGTSKAPNYLVYGTDFEIAGYQNNVKKGTMKVILQSIDETGKCSGTKTISIKIVARSMAQ